MVIFIDTSSLIKRYVQEEGSGDVDAYFRDENDICIAPTTAIELRAALSIKLREKSISADSHEKAIGSWEFEERSFDTVAFDESLVLTALDMIDRYPVKTLDSIQLAAAMVSAPDAFITSDKQLYQIALLEMKDRAVII
jgi:uncharacterized protein